MIVDNSLDKLCKTNLNCKFIVNFSLFINEDILDLLSIKNKDLLEKYLNLEKIIWNVNKDNIKYDINYLFKDSYKNL